MKYVMIHYTSDIDTKNNTAKIRYFSLGFISPFNAYCKWVDNINEAYRYNTREEVEADISNNDLINCISYGVEE